MHLKLLYILLFFILTSCMGITKNGKEKQPNIILFLVDDMGWQDTSVPFWHEKTEFNKRYNTPGMARLANEGMLFTQAYATSVCSPTRVSLMSGMNAARHRVTNWTLWRNTSVDGPHEILGYPDWNVNGIQPVDSIERSVYATMLPQILKDNGYFTIHCGKAHLGAMNTPAANPENCGFEVNIAGHAAGGLGSFLGTENFGNKEKGGHTLPWGVPGMEKYHGDTIFLTEALNIEARKALDKALDANKPFYLYMSHYAVHIPLNADMRFYQKYLDMGLPEPEAKYASMIEAMDKSLKDLMDYLDEKGIADNTIVLFMSDNGGLSASHRAGEPHTHNSPLNSGKGSAYEGGIRVPMIVKWPGLVKPGSVSDKMLIIEDFFPTILEMAGVKEYKTVQTVDGKSFVPLLLNPEKETEVRDLFWHFPNNWGPTGPGIGATSTIRSDDWKLIYYYHDQHFELFNIPEDIGEQNNLANELPEKVNELARKLGEYLRNADAQRPVIKETGQQVPWPDENPLFFKDRLQPLTEKNIFKTEDYFNWCSSIIKGDDGKYHLFYSRWPKKYTFLSWLTHSEVAHAIADTPAGPWKYKETVLQSRGKGHWDAITVHNPKIKKFGDKYYLYYVSTNMGDQDYTEEELIETARVGYKHPNWIEYLRPNQRTGVAVAESINGPWKRMDKPLIEPSGPITTLTVNPAIAQGKDGKYYLIVKGDKPNDTGFVRNQAVAISDSPTGPFKMQPGAVIDDMDTEDMSVWYDAGRDRFYGIFHAHSFIGMIYSPDGINWRKATEYVVQNKRIPLVDGSELVPERMERPFLYQEDGEPKVLSMAVKKGDDAFIVFVPLANKINQEKR